MSNILRTYWNDLLVEEIMYNDSSLKHGSHKKWSLDGLQLFEHNYHNHRADGLFKEWRFAKKYGYQFWYIKTWKTSNIHGVGVTFDYGYFSFLNK